MSDNYHINPDTGRANQCNAKIKCRFGADTKHYGSKEEARGAYEQTMKKQTVSKPLKKDSKNGKSALKKQLPIIPGVRPVMTDAEIRGSVEELVAEVNEWTPPLTGFSVKELLKTREITLKDIEESEECGRYSISAKVPSYSELEIPTDVARSELGLPRREKTGIDNTPLRKAEIAYHEAHLGTFGSLSEKQLQIAREKLTKARNEYEALRYPDRKQETPRLNRRGFPIY